jgi:putative DNA primase/helicase
MSTSLISASEISGLESHGIPVEMSDRESLTVKPRLGVGKCKHFLLSEIDRMIGEKQATEGVLHSVSLINQERCETPLPAEELRSLVESRSRFLASTDPQPLEYSDDALAREFSGEHERILKYVGVQKQWLYWKGTHWQPDETGMTIEEVRRFTARKAQALLKGDDAKKKLGLATHLSSSATIHAIERLARSDPRHATALDTWNADPWIISTPSGVVDLETGVLRTALPEDYCSKLTAVGPSGDCPIWRGFLDRVTGGDTELQAYLQRVIGYALTGSTREDVLFFFYGTGGNGKSTLLETIKGILNDYATSVPLGTLMASKNERHPADLASLYGARMAVATETESGRSWDETRIKLLTGRDDVKARYMRQDFFEFQPEFKLLIAGNNKPHFGKVDQAIRRRVHLIPFAAQITDPDVNLPDKLRAEWPGILQWAIDGALEWQKQGLHPPKAVIAATEEYLSQEDTVGRWVADCCELGPGGEELSAGLWGSWERWCKENGERAGGRNILTQRLGEQYGLTKTKIGHAGKRGLSGIRLKKGVEECSPASTATVVPVRADLVQEGPRGRERHE